MSVAFLRLIQESEIDDSQNKLTDINKINFETEIVTKAAFRHRVKEKSSVQSQEERLINSIYIHYFHLQCLLK